MVSYCNFQLSHAESFTCFTLAIQCNLDSTVSQSIASINNLSSIVTSALCASVHIVPWVV